MNRVSNERVAQLNRELNIAKARNASLSETRKIEDEILAERTKAHNKSVGFLRSRIKRFGGKPGKVEAIKRYVIAVE